MHYFLAISPYFFSIVFVWVPSLALFAARHREVSYPLIYSSNRHSWTWPVRGPVFVHLALAPRNLRDSGLHFPAFGLHFARPGSILRIPGSILWDPLLGIGFWNPKSHKLWFPVTRSGYIFVIIMHIGLVIFMPASLFHCLYEPHNLWNQFGITYCFYQFRHTSFQ